MSLPGKKLICLLFLIVSLSACKQEPMINLSKENQMKIEKKQAQLQQDKNTSQDNENRGFGSSDQIVLDPNTWTKESAEVIYDLENYLPYYANQVKEYSDGEISYVDYFDPTMQQLQARKKNYNQEIIELYRWNNDSIQEYGRIESDAKRINFLTTQLEENQMEQSDIFLQAPVKEGTKWSNKEGEESEIKALYQKIIIEDQTFNEVIEIVTKLSEGARHQLIAANQGIIAQWQEGSDKQYYATNITDNVMLVDKEELFMPYSSSNEPFIKLEQVDFAWQTNDTLATAFQRFFHDNGWIGPEIQVVDIYENNGIAHLNFSSGVVATINQHLAGEKAVVNAMMANIANYYEVSQVSLEVFGNGMLLNTIPYPANGIYKIDAKWLESQNGSNNEKSVEKTVANTEELTFE